VAFLELRGVHKTYGNGTRALERVDLAVEPGEFVSLLGPSGCGKTTLLRIVAGFETPSGGSVLVEGRDITRVPPNRRKMGMVFQNYALFPNLTVAGNIGFGLTVAGWQRPQIEARVAELLDLIHLPDYWARYPHQLSGGQQQRVALARALAVQPRLLLLDEPLSALDARIRQSLRHEIRAIQQTLRIPTLYVTHDQDEALSLSDRVVVMNSGRVEQIGSPAEIYHHPRTLFVGTFVGSLNVLPATVDDPARGSFRLMGQGLQLAPELATGRAPGEPVVIACRPEQVNLEDGPAATGLRGVVDEVTFLGSVVRVGLQCADAHVLVDVLSGDHRAPAQLGETRQVRLRPEACLVLDPPPPGADR
jgi:putative spermidine/putrescine transport system ATP-binding protein